MIKLLILFVFLISFSITQAYALEGHIQINKTGEIFDADDDGTCDDTGGAVYDLFNESQSHLRIFKYNTTDSLNDCARSYMEFDVSTVQLPVTIQSGTMYVYVACVTLMEESPIDVYSMTSPKPSTRTNAQAFDEIDDGLLIQTWTPLFLDLYGIVEDVGCFDYPGLIELDTFSAANLTHFSWRIDMKNYKRR